MWFECEQPFLSGERCVTSRKTATKETSHRSDALQAYKRVTEEQLLKVSKIVQSQKEKESTVKGNSNSALTYALEIPSSSETLVVNVCGGNCNITINNN